MALVTVTETLKIGAVPLARCKVFVRLVASDSDPFAPGYAPASDTTIADVGETITNASGVWTMQLEPNANITPASNVYRIDYVYPSGVSPDPVYISVAVSPSTQRVEDITTSAPNLEQTDQVDRVSEASFDGHSFGRIYASQARLLYHRRVSEQLGLVEADRHVSGSKILSLGCQGGFSTAMQLDEPPLRTYAGQGFPARPGMAVLMTGINDIQTWASSGDWSQLKTALAHCFRAWISWQILSGYWHHDEASTGQTFAGSGSWLTGSYSAGLQAGPGSGYRYNASSGATWTIVTDADSAGQYVSLFFLTNRSGGSLAASTVSITLDGVAYTTRATDAINPSAVAVSGITCARVLLPSDGAAHTIVATAASGGMTVAGWGVEAPRTVIVANVSRRSDAGYTPNGSDAIVLEWNTQLATVVAEFASDQVCIADIYTALGTSSANFGDGLHPNDTGHELVARAVLSAFDTQRRTMTAQQIGLL